MNPYAPLAAELDGTPPPRRRSVGLVLLGLAVPQLLWFVLCLPVYSELVRTGVVSAIGALGSVVGCSLLFLGTVRFALNAAKGQRLFIASLILVVLSLRAGDCSSTGRFPMLSLSCLRWPAGGCLANGLRLRTSAKRVLSVRRSPEIDEAGKRSANTEIGTGPGRVFAIG